MLDGWRWGPAEAPANMRSSGPWALGAFCWVQRGGGESRARGARTEAEPDTSAGTKSGLVLGGVELGGGGARLVDYKWVERRRSLLRTLTAESVISLSLSLSYISFFVLVLFLAVLLRERESESERESSVRLGFLLERSQGRRRRLESRWPEGSVSRRSRMRTSIW